MKIELDTRFSIGDIVFVKSVGGYVTKAIVNTVTVTVDAEGTRTTVRYTFNTFNDTGQPVTLVAPPERVFATAEDAFAVRS